MAGAVRRAHAHFYMDLAERLRRQMPGPGERALLARMDQEQDNIRAALRWALEAGAGEIALRLVTAMGRFWYVRGHLVEGQRWMAAALASGADLPARLRARALTEASGLALAQNDFAQVRSLAEESLRLWQQVPDPTPEPEQPVPVPEPEPEPEPEPDKPPPDIKAKGGGDFPKTGVPDCDKFLKNYMACMDKMTPMMGENNVKQIRDSMRQAAQQWKDAAKYPQAKEALGDACKQMVPQMRDAFKSYGCDF